MTKTANQDPNIPTPPPTDKALIRAWIEEGEGYTTQAKIAQGDAEYWRLVGHAQARAELAEMLEGNRRAREAYVKDAGDRLVRAAEKAGQAVADFLNKAYKTAEDRADQDRN